MKYSHLVTPRTMGDACFIPSGAAIEKPYKSFDKQDVLVIKWSIIALLILVVVVSCMPQPA